MSRKFLRRYLPDPDTLLRHRSLRPFHRWLKRHPDLWHLNRRSVSLGLAIGLFMAFVPMPMQSVPATALSILLRGNIPAAIAGAWVTNPITIPPLSLLCYHIGVFLLGGAPPGVVFEPSWDWLTSEMSRIWQPFVLGCLVVGCVSAVAAYFGTRLLWRWQVIRNWEKRKRTRHKR